MTDNGGNLGWSGRSREVLNLWFSPKECPSPYASKALRLGHVRLIVQGQVYDGRLTIVTVNPPIYLHYFFYPNSYMEPMVYSHFCITKTL